jgi:uncharacterized glyoxalase superfamily protein PhnB
MAERTLIEQLDDAIQALLARPDVEVSASQLGVDEKLGPLLTIASRLRDLPRSKFKAQLKQDLLDGDKNHEKSERSTSMATTGSAAVHYLPKGFHTVTPYIMLGANVKADEFIEFLKKAFGATGVLRVPRGDGGVMHAEVRVGDSIIETADFNPQYPPTPVGVILAVDDADAVYKRAIAAGGESLHEPVTQPYGDREASVRDLAGNYWFITTRRKSEHTPNDQLTVTPCLNPRGAAQLIEFLKAAFGAEVFARYDSPAGAVEHAKIRIGDSYLALGEGEGAKWPRPPCALHMYVPDADAAYRQAVAAGATSVRKPEDAPYGDRVATVFDPAGNQWFLATHIKDVTF